MKRTFSTLLTLLVVFAFVGCSSDDDSNPTGPGGTDPVDQFSVVAAAGDTYFATYKNAAGQGVNITASDLFNNIDDFYVIDVRAAADFANAHVIGARNIPLGEIVNEIDTFPTDQTIVVMCYSGQSASVATSAINLIGTETGHYARNLKFGSSGLMDAVLVKADGTFGYKTSNDHVTDMVQTAAPTMPVAGDFPVVETTATTTVEILKERAAYAISQWGNIRMSATAAADHNPAEIMLINYWKAGAYANGHLDGAFWYTPKDGDTPNDFLSTTNLNTLPLDKTVAIYCYTGQTSAQLVTYLTMLGYDAKTVMFGVQDMCFDDTTINTVQWHGPENDYTSILEGAAFAPAK